MSAQVLCVGSELLFYPARRVRCGFRGFRQTCFFSFVVFFSRTEEEYFFGRFSFSLSLSLSLFFGLSRPHIGWVTERGTARGDTPRPRVPGRSLRGSRGRKRVRVSVLHLAVLYFVFNLVKRVTNTQRERERERERGG